MVLIDFDLESHSLFQYFHENQLPTHGLLDYLAECGAYDMGKSVCVEDYIHQVTDIGSTADGAIYIIPACGTGLLSHPEDYRRALMHVSFDLATYRQYQITPFDEFLAQIDALVHPDYLLIDSRSGMHQIAGITINRYSGLSLLFFSGNTANAFGMELMLPVLKKYGVPYLLIHSKAPAYGTRPEKDRRDYRQEAWIYCADKSFADSPILDDPTGKFFPFELPERPELAHVSTLQGLLNIFPVVEREYAALAEEIMRKLPPSEPFDSLKHLRLAEKKAKDENLAAALRYAYRDEDPAQVEEIIQRILREES